MREGNISIKLSFSSEGVAFIDPAYGAKRRIGRKIEFFKEETYMSTVKDDKEYLKECFKKIKWLTPEKIIKFYQQESAAVSNYVFYNVYGNIASVHIPFAHIGKIVEIPEGLYPLEQEASTKIKRGWRGSVWVNNSLKIVVNRYFISFVPEISNQEAITEIVFKLLDGLEKPIKENTFSMICRDNGTYYCEPCELQKHDIKEERFDLFYGKDFPDEKIKAFFGSKESLLLLHGEPGGGKTNYIKYLIASSPRNVIYVPPGMMSFFSSPDFLPFLMRQKGSMILIEDAEEALQAHRTAATNNILNATDGLLKDALDIKFVCTFNTKLENIDSAMTRKGRLYMEHEFRKLTPIEANELAEFCGITGNFMHSVTLAEIFNQDADEANIAKSTPLGFGTF